ncbi:alpha/beta hydrolase [Pleionea sp. CnH1-48]|uniref:alpha/beta hydrolase n=1 Tax=Pleionea sp. CnH1-48 TaxID=2954494 RepID=UPI002097C87C|nr:alpha/beta hydrolase [Pleionea sp. CnH1-48]MCO7223297.1 alpha/beta hydrolase [Pleionea sp. CnH1-48]
MTHYDSQLNLRKRHPLGRFALLKNEVDSFFTRLSSSGSLDISYGPSSEQKLDIFPAAQPQSPVFIFIHGGYFRSLDKRQYSFLAKPLNRAGYTAVFLNHDLAPKVKVVDIVEQNISAMKWVVNNIQQWNGDPKRITLCGHSVGAFLAAKILEHPFQNKESFYFEQVNLLSGIYDLEPLRQSYLNASLKLSLADVESLSLNHQPSQTSTSIFISVGGDESEEFIRQSQSYSGLLHQNGYGNKLSVIKNVNHYGMVKAFAKSII